VSWPDDPVDNVPTPMPIVPSASPDEPSASWESKLRSTIEWVAVVITALAAALLIKEYVFQAFEIPSASMERTVNIGDRILVNKLSYSFGDVSRGDLVVFERLAGTPGTTDDLIKRAIALPGETIEVRSDGRIWIWGPGETAEDAARLEESYLDTQNAVLAAPAASDPLSVDVWDTRCVNQPRELGRCTLDDSSYFMMGDNRNASSDSRFFGPVPEANVVGRAFLRIWPLGDLSTL
jgi:signal peptidase I